MNNFINNHLNILKKNNFKNADIELRAILNKTSISKKEVIFSNFNINQINLKIFKKAFKRRLKNEPIAKIFNQKYFWNYEFYTDRNVLDPRPETEFLIETVKKYFRSLESKIKFIDIGTGSGCIAVTLAKEYPNSEIVATDISKKSLKVAKINSFKHNTLKQIKFIYCNWINTLELFDVVVSNPPYLNEKEYRNTSNDIKLFEPKRALYGGRDGMDCYQKIAKKITKITHKNSYSFIEIGHNQKIRCEKIFKNYGMKCIETVVDYQKHDRILVFKKNID